MVVLSPRKGQQIVVPGHDWTITVLDIAGDRVRLGLSGPSRNSTGCYEALDTSSVYLLDQMVAARPWRPF